MGAGTKVAVDFDEIIQADRQRRNNERLAREIFGRGRRASGPGAMQGPRKPGTGQSLASRVGVVKRSASHSFVSPTTKQNQPNRPTKPAGNVDADWTHDLHEVDPLATTRGTQFRRRNGTGNNGDREVRLYKALNGSSSSPALNSQFNVVSKPKQSGGISIRGLAGPSIVVAENFAPGTTAADIESAMAPIGGTILKCSVASSASTVIAELVFESREGAENVISEFHNQTADGRILRLYHKPGPAPVPVKSSNTLTEAASAAPPLGPRADLVGDRSENTRTTRYGGSDRYEPRDRSREMKRDFERDDVMDGTYGFDDPMDTDELEGSRNGTGGGRGLYSDDLVYKRGGRGDGGRGFRDQRDGARGGDRGRDRGRGYR